MIILPNNERCRTQAKGKVETYLMRGIRTTMAPSWMQIVKNSKFTATEFVCGWNVGPKALVAMLMASIRLSRKTISNKMSNKGRKLSNENVVEGGGLSRTEAQRRRMYRHHPRRSY